MNSKTGSFIASSIELEDENFHFTKKKKKIKTNLKEEIFWLSRDEKKELIFEFKNFQKYINEGQTIIINDNTFKAFGIITKVFYPEDEKLFFVNKIYTFISQAIFLIILVIPLILIILVKNIRMKI